MTAARESSATRMSREWQKRMIGRMDQVRGSRDFRNCASRSVSGAMTTASASLPVHPPEVRSAYRSIWLMLQRYWLVGIGTAIVAIAIIAWNVSVWTTAYCDVAGPGDFILLDDVLYVRAPDCQRFARSEVDVRRITATVKRQDSGFNDCEFRPRDGDASDLPVGTPLYAMDGSSPTLRLATLTAHGQVIVYEAVTDEAFSATGSKSRRDHAPPSHEIVLADRRGWSVGRMPVSIGTVDQVGRDLDAISTGEPALSAPWHRPRMSFRGAESSTTLT